MNSVQLYRDHTGKCIWRDQKGGIAKLFQSSLMTALQHRHSSAGPNTEGARSRMFQFFHNLISSLSRGQTYQSLSSAFWATVTYVSYFCLAFCMFLPHSFNLSHSVVHRHTVPEISNSALCTTPYKTCLFSLIYFCSSLSQYLRKQTLLFHYF